MKANAVPLPLSETRGINGNGYVTRGLGKPKLTEQGGKLYVDL